jgi:hypothetical protein
MVLGNLIPNPLKIAREAAAAFNRYVKEANVSAECVLMKHTHLHMCGVCL